MSASTPGIVPIRPKVVFGKIENKFAGQNVGFKVNVPPSGIGGTTLLESSILVSLVKLFDARRIFEFGTYLGASTLLLAENTPEDAAITTLDIDNQAADSLPDAAGLNVLSNDKDNDNYLRSNFLNRGAMYLNRGPESARRKVQQIFHDSRTLDVAGMSLGKRFDYIFIDGGHDYDTIEIDTANALKMAADDAVILWHDFESKIHGDVTRYVRHYASGGPTVYHVENTMIAFQLLGKHREAFDRL